MNPRVVTPLVTTGAAWATRKGMNAAYAARHDGSVPTAEDTSVPFRQVLFWSLATAVVAALVNVAISQGMARLAQNYDQN